MRFFFCFSIAEYHYEVYKSKWTLCVFPETDFVVFYIHLQPHKNKTKSSCYQHKQMNDLVTFLQSLSNTQGIVPQQLTASRNISPYFF